MNERQQNSLLLALAVVLAWISVANGVSTCRVLERLDEIDRDEQEPPF